METKTPQEKVWRLQLPRWKRESIIKFVIVLGMAAAGSGMIAGGLLAWIVGEEILLLTGVVAGSIFVCAGGLGFLKCLDGALEK